MERLLLRVIANAAGDVQTVGQIERRLTEAGEDLALHPVGKVGSDHAAPHRIAGIGPKIGVGGLGIVIIAAPSFFNTLCISFTNF